jgi:hypothetical protein
MQGYLHSKYQTCYTAHMEQFDVIERVVEKRKLLTSLDRSKDGFNRMDVVNAFQEAFRMIGGVPRMALWANANPDKFYPLYSKLMPSTAITIGDNANVVIQHAIPPGALDDHPE